jgi:HSP20 family protein
MASILMRTDPFRDLERLTQQMFGGATGTAARPSVMPMDAWREQDTFVVEFDLPGVKSESIDLDVERNVVTVRAERRLPESGDREVLAAERPWGVFSRQLVLGDNLDTERIEADYDSGVLRLRIPVSERAKPRKIAVGGAHTDRQTVTSHVERSEGGGEQSAERQAQDRETVNA